jgi:transcriptional regulator with XRE-family HTH domain
MPEHATGNLDAGTLAHLHPALQGLPADAKTGADLFGSEVALGRHLVGPSLELSFLFKSPALSLQAPTSKGMPPYEVKMSQPSFRASLKEWRHRQGLSQRDLDTAMGRKRSFTSNLEAGLTKPPDRATCTRLGEVLEVPGEVVWRAAREERLRAFDEELWEYYEGGATLTARTDSEAALPSPTAIELELLEYLRWLDGEFPGHDTPMAEHFANAVLTILLEKACDGTTTPTEVADATVDCIRGLQNLSREQQKALMIVCVHAFRAISVAIP